MIETTLQFLETVRDDAWTYIGFPVILGLGLFLSFRSRFLQFRKFPFILSAFYKMLTISESDHKGVHPLGALFTSLGGCVGIGNVVAICGAVQIGGPGALFWVWIAAGLGMILKYAEVYLGMKFRITNQEGAYEGGPMYYLQRVFKTMWIPNILAFLLCLYGVEIYQFNIITSSVSTNFHVNYVLATFIILGLVIYTASGGIQRVANVSSTIIPVFIVLYLSMGLWVLVHNLGVIPGVIATVFQSAFTGHAALGGFVGSTMMMAISQGIAQGCYSTDVGIGYASIIHSESRVQVPQKQACLTIFEIFLDSFVICTMSILLILVTGVWKEPIHESVLVQTALAEYFPMMHFFMPIFLLLLGYSTIISFFFVGIKCAEYLSPKNGRQIFYIAATLSLFLFSFIESRQTLIVMSFVGVLLLFINLYGIYRLRDELAYNLDFDSIHE